MYERELSVYLLGLAYFPKHDNLQLCLPANDVVLLFFMAEYYSIV